MLTANRQLMKGVGDGDASKLLQSQRSMAELQSKDISQSLYQIVNHVLEGRDEAQVKVTEGTN